MNSPEATMEIGTPDTSTSGEWKTVEIYPGKFMSCHPSIDAEEMVAKQKAHHAKRGAKTRRQGLPEPEEPNPQNDDRRITRILNGQTEYIPTSRDRILELVKQRFGCVYQALPEHFKRDEEILFEATVASAGRVFVDHAPEDFRDALPTSFYVRAIRSGARIWMMNVVRASNLTNSDVQQAYADQVESENEALTKMLSDYR